MIFIYLKTYQQCNVNKQIANQAIFITAHLEMSLNRYADN